MNPLLTGTIDRTSEAKRLRAEGLTYREIGERLGVCTQTAYRRVNDDYRERHNAVGVAWKDRNREANRARDRAYDYARRREGTHPCRCGRAFLVAEQIQCGKCAAEDHAEGLRQQIHDMWHAGAKIPEIAVATGKSKGYIGGTIARMRDAGWDMPHRYNRSVAA